MAQTNGNAAAVRGQESFAKVFPDGITSLKEADPEVAALVEEEKKRQW
jgi:hypothetical protein